MRKIDGAALEALREAIAPLNTYERRTAYRNSEFARADLVKDLDRRYRWDLFWGAKGCRVLTDNGVDTGDILDSHIDTALRDIVPTLDLFVVVGGISHEGGDTE